MTGRALQIQPEALHKRNAERRRWWRRRWSHRPACLNFDSKKTSKQNNNNKTLHLHCICILYLSLEKSELLKMCMLFCIIWLKKVLFILTFVCFVQITEPKYTWRWYTAAWFGAGGVVVAFFLTCKDLGGRDDGSFPACTFFLFKVEINSWTPIPLL